MDPGRKIGLDALKIATKKIADKAAEAKGEFIGNKIANKIVNPKLCLIWIQEILKK